MSYSPAGSDGHSPTVVGTSRAQTRRCASGGRDVSIGPDGRSWSTKPGAARSVTIFSDDPRCNVMGGSSLLPDSRFTQAGAYPGASTSKGISLIEAPGYAPAWVK